MTDHPPPSSAAIRSRRYRQRRQRGVQVVTVEVNDIHVKALRANGLLDATEPKLALGIELLLSMFAAGVFSTDAEKLDALLVSAGVAPQAGVALRSPPV